MYTHLRKRCSWLFQAVLGSALLFVAAGSQAHHSFAMFDASKEVTVTGVVTVFRFSNPHTSFRLDVVEKEGAKPVSYLFEGPTPVILKRLGWASSTLKPGDKVKVMMHPLKDGSPGGHAQKVWLPDGKDLSLVAEDIKYK